MAQKMNKRIKAEWIVELRSGKYVQGTGQLRKVELDSFGKPHSEFCCLGVLCNMYAKAHPRLAAKEKDPMSFMGEDCFPPLKVYKWAGFKTINQHDQNHILVGDTNDSLAEVNDGGASFNEIADILVKHF
jgi:hypothetical protein